jgi:GAF domain-containing protein
MIDGLDKVERIARQRARGKKWAVRLTYVSSIVLFPVLETMLFTFQDDIVSAIGDAFWFVAALVILLHIFSGLLAFSFSTSDNLYFEYVDLVDEKDELEKRLQEEREDRKQWENSEAAGYFALRAFSNFIVYCKEKENEGISVGEVKDWVGKILLVAERKRAEVFGYSASAKHNIAVYLHDDETDQLRKFYRVVDDRIKIRNRPWKPGFGHVGLCFQREKAIISSDIRNAPQLTEDMGRGDETDYRSIAAAPIFELDSEFETRQPRGVLIVTSSRPGQLSESRHETLLLTLTSILSLFFHHADKNIAPEASYVEGQDEG